MRIDVRGKSTFVSTGGRAFDPSGTVLLFLHGSGQSHLSFLLQGRFLANRGWQVLNPDLPAHGFSDGPPLETIEDMADWSADLLEAAGVETAHAIGHSQGGLIGLELARRHPEKVSSLSLIATALAIPVNPSLLSMARDDEKAAIAAMTDWGHGREGHFHDNTMPGLDLMRYDSHVMENNRAGTLFADLSACAAYTDGETAASEIDKPCLCVLAMSDRMTPVKQGHRMASALKDSRAVVVSGAGHMLPGERPFEVLTALREFLPAPG